MDELSSRDQTVREGETVMLICNVTGVPTPEVKWFKLGTRGLSTDKESLYFCSFFFKYVCNYLQNVSWYFISQFALSCE